MTASCGTCRYFSALKRECRRNPPTAHLAQGATGVVCMTAFPIVTESTWCGAYDANQDHDCVPPPPGSNYIGSAWTCETCAQVWERVGLTGLLDDHWTRKTS